MKKTLLFFILWMLSFSIHAQVSYTLPSNAAAGEEYVYANPTSPGSEDTFIVPVGVTVDVSVQAWGGGGGPQNSQNNNNSSRSGGGGGGYAKSNITLTAGTYTIFVGQGGVDNMDGEDSTFETNVVIARGGKKGSGNGGAGGSFIGDEGNNGGDGGKAVAQGDGGGGGGAGGNGGAGANGEDGPNKVDGGFALGGAGGAAGIDGPGGGAGGAGGDVDNIPAAQSGTFPGGGGGGKGDSVANSGKGANGQVIITVVASPLLPVELTSFESKVIDNNSVILFWNTASEENNSHFVIEHSRDGQRFNEIGQKTGMGTTTIPHTYSMRHERLAKGFHYYRLKQVDFDGKYEYSNIISAKLKLTLKDISIAPNPAMEKVTVFIDTPISIAASYQLVNMQKEIMLERTVAEGNSSFQIDMTDLPAGVYFMRFYVDQQVISKKIVKLY